MFSYDISDELRKKLKYLSKKDKILVMNFKKKLSEIITRDNETINTYKNLKSPMNECKRVHLTSKFILIFKVIETEIIFVDIMHRDYVYKDKK